MAHEKIVTMFSTLAQAEGAKRNLIKAGFSDHNIDVLYGDHLKSEGHEARHPSIWQRLFGKTVDEEQAEVFEDALNSGGVVLTLRASEDELPRALSIIDAHDTVDMPGRNPASNRDDEIYAGYATSQEPAVAGTDATLPVRTSLKGDESEEDVLRLAQERVEIGKRLVSEGTTRVRRYTVTDDVAEDVSLHEQHADIFRRSVGNIASPEDVDWTDKTIEVAETHERPVINKTAEVKEELVVRKDQSDHVETVSDTVRRQEADIEHVGETENSTLRKEDPFRK